MFLLLQEFPHSPHEHTQEENRNADLLQLRCVLLSWLIISASLSSPAPAISCASKTMLAIKFLRRIPGRVLVAIIVVVVFQLNSGIKLYPK